MVLLRRARSEKRRRDKALAMAGIATVLLAACTPSYVYVPTEMVNASTEGYPTARYPVPQEAPHGEVYVTSFGIVDMDVAPGPRRRCQDPPGGREQQRRSALAGRHAPAGGRSGPRGAQPPRLREHGRAGLAGDQRSARHQAGDRPLLQPAGGDAGGDQRAALRDPLAPGHPGPARRAADAVRAARGAGAGALSGLRRRRARLGTVLVVRPRSIRR